MKNIVLTIGREYGSGGKYIGQKVAERLKIPFYDKELIKKICEKNGYNYEKLELYDEVKRNSILKAMELLNSNNYELVAEDDKCQYLIQETIKEFAKKPCVILGRSSNTILKENDNIISIFIYSNDLEFKIKRKMEIEKISYEEALKKLKHVDKQRKKYYEDINKNHIWGDKKEYDFCIDSSKLGIEGTIELIIEIYKKALNGNN